MSKFRYVFTGGDNGFCARCGGYGDRALLVIDDENKTYRAFYRAPSCLGEHCWRKEELYGGRVIARGVLSADGNKLTYDFLSPKKNKIYIVSVDGEKMHFDKVTVKHNKYGKDGEFGDKLDNYTYEGTVEPKELVEQWREESLQAMKRYYEKEKGEKNYA